MRVHLETERLILRHFTPADVDLVTDLDRDPEVLRYLGADAASRDVVERDGFFAAIEKASGEFAGWFEFRPLDEGEVELGYRLRRRFWGRGYATEGARALIAKGFTEGGVRRVVAFTMSVNTGSRRVMEKAGLRYVRTFHEDWPDPLPGAEHGDVEYALSEDDWNRQHGLP
ncbi:GNAT family acetyltransferase [Amycolatopsis deserti]|uniref:GNAT family acetyltransferase n=1 Tax=Amycolatopsis deserti TaxID=185696 RepID=A0ABQ3JEF6_9PSEU|nr:GNAT family N-acetyltransferase [Amycolatopsis deserti]GHF26382.1 GNAT family acetyltransferase [Amycolatopsis deserti]